MCLWVVRVAPAHFAHNAVVLHVALDIMLEELPVCHTQRIL